MHAARFVAPLACFAVLWGVAPSAQAQDYPFQGLAAMDAMNTLHHNLLTRTIDAAQERRDKAATQRGQGAGRAPTPASPSSATHRAVAPADLTFRRDPGVTRGIHADLVQRVSRSHAEAGHALAQDLAQRDPLTVATPVFRRFGLDTGNVVDATAIYLMAMWGVANNVHAQMTPTQARGARAHVARTVNFAGMGLNSAAARQRYADSLIYQGLLMDSALEQAQAKKDTAQQRILADAAQGQMKRMGMDMRRLTITDQGFVAR